MRYLILGLVAASLPFWIGDWYVNRTARAADEALGSIIPVSIAVSLDIIAFILAIVYIFWRTFFA
jgi:hypothetical protein